MKQRPVQTGFTSQPQPFTQPWQPSMSKTTLTPADIAVIATFIAGTITLTYQTGRAITRAAFWAINRSQR